MDYLNCLATKYADRAQVLDIGNSVEQRSLKVIKIGKPCANGSAKPAIWIDGGIHAREWISPSSVEYVIQQFVENYNASGNSKYVDNFDIYILPISNPDGLVSPKIMFTSF